MASIDIENAFVSYYLRKRVEAKAADLKRGSVGAPIVSSGSHVEIQALRDVSLHFKDGDRVGLVGLNGSGKSTLLQLCAGALSAQKGTIRVDGKVSPQFSLGAGIKRTLSGRRNAELKCLYMGTPQRQIAARVEEIKELSGLGGFFELPVSSYSAGMRSRLVMSLIRLVKGDILVMDEWIGTADGTVNKAVGQLRRELLESSSLLIMASHAERVLKEWVTTLVWLDAGEVRAVGSVDEIYPEYRKVLAIDEEPEMPRKKRQRRPRPMAK
jgi:ABC-type polysaccharide/polyol phosphate transport system ATPase subunit